MGWRGAWEKFLGMLFILSLLDLRSESSKVNLVLSWPLNQPPLSSLDLDISDESVRADMILSWNNRNEPWLIQAHRDLLKDYLVCSQIHQKRWRTRLERYSGEGEVRQPVFQPKSWSRTSLVTSLTLNSNQLCSSWTLQDLLAKSPVACYTLRTGNWGW